MSLTSNSVIIADSHITVCFTDGFQVTLYATDPNFSRMKDAVRDGEWVKARELSEPVEAVRKAVEGVEGGTVHIDNGVVICNGKELHNTLTDRMLAMLADGFDVTPLMLFLDNLVLNPSFRAVTELYDFLEASQLPITEDGCFLAYKRIRSDYTDVRTGNFDNSIGTVVSMPRNEVDEDKDRTCSAGLHFCSRAYLPHFSGDRVVVLKINPADVVAIPSDYDNAKGRTCRYEVIQELESEAPAELEGHSTSDSATAGVLALDSDGEVASRYESLEDAAEKTGIPKAYIARVLRGDRTATGGYGWAYELRVDIDDVEDADSSLEDLDDDDPFFGEYE